jgi:hypothetical protein
MIPQFVLLHFSSFAALSQEASLFILVNRAIRTELTIPILQFTSLHHSNIHRLLREPDAFVGVEP